RAAGPGSPRCGNCGAPLPWVTDAGDADFAEIAEQADVPVIVDLWAPWCGPCRWVSPALERLATEFAGRVKLVKVNVDGAANLARRFDAQGIPTLIVLDHGRVMARLVGAAPEPRLRDWLEAALRQRGESSAGAA
ncbi:MAG: thioredoxin, partial [Actinobacteria bacterium]|nr:thioredoxin [Actinomycetota bacterium]